MTVNPMTINVDGCYGESSKEIISKSVARVAA